MIPDTARPTVYDWKATCDSLYLSLQEQQP